MSKLTYGIHPVPYRTLKSQFLRIGGISFLHIKGIKSPLVQAYVPYQQNKPIYTKIYFITNLTNTPQNKRRIKFQFVRTRKSKSCRQIYGYTTPITSDKIQIKVNGRYQSGGKQLCNDYRGLLISNFAATICLIAAQLLVRRRFSRSLTSTLIMRNQILR